MTHCKLISRQCVCCYVNISNTEADCVPRMMCGSRRSTELRCEYGQKGVEVFWSSEKEYELRLATRSW